MPESCPLAPSQKIAVGSSGSWQGWIQSGLSVQIQMGGLECELFPNIWCLIAAEVREVWREEILLRIYWEMRNRPQKCATAGQK